jgi:peptidoglycan L-alanyl-D-glutamate endopeptidase CwlK
MSGRLSPDEVLFQQRILRASGVYSGRLDGTWGAATDQAINAFEDMFQQLASELGTFDPRSEGCIHSLQIPAQAAARKALKVITDSGIPARIISGTRTYAEQDALYRQGRFGNPGKVITKARGGQSNHNFGIAWDIGIFVDGKYLGESALYSQAGAAITDAGLSDLEWGGSWVTFKDLPHYQLATGLALADLRRQFEDG